MLNAKQATVKYSEGGMGKTTMPLGKMFALAFMAGMETAGAEGQEEFSYETAAVITRTADEAREAYYILQKKLEAEGFDTKERLSLLHRDSTNFKHCPIPSIRSLAKTL